MEGEPNPTSTSCSPSRPVHLWSQCENLLSSSLDNRDEVDILLIEKLPHLLSLDFSEQGENEGSSEQDLWNLPSFLYFIRSGLLSDNILTRKRSLFVLELIIPHALRRLKSSNDDFARFPTSEEVLAHSKSKSKGKKGDRKKPGDSMHPNKKPDMTPTLEQKWQSYILLIQTLDEFAFHLAEAAWPAQINVLSHVNKTSEAIDKGDLLTSFEVDFPWMTVVWTKGLAHGNPHVRRMVLKSFLDQRSYHGSVASEEFVLGPLLKALNDPENHKDFGTNGAYSSTTSSLASDFFKLFSKRFNSSSLLSFVSDLVSSAVAMSPCRSGLMAIAMCMEACVTGSAPSTADSHPTTESKLLSSRLLDSLRLLVEDTKRHFNPHYRAKVYRNVCLTLVNCVEITNVEVPAVSVLLSGMPNDLFKPSGALCPIVIPWIIGGSVRPSWLLAGLNSTLEDFLSPQTGAVDLLSEEQVDRWQEEALRWSKLFLMAVSSKAEILELLTTLSLKMEAVWTGNRSSAPVSYVELKSLLLVSCLIATQPQPVQVAEVMSGMISMHLDAISWKAQQASCIFWQHSETGQTECLPGQVTGKLGGRSQRRLPASVASPAISSLVSLRVASECFLWLLQSQVKSSELQSLAHFWRFAQEFVNFADMHTSHMNETQSELKLAALEALVSVSQALAASCCDTRCTSPPAEHLTIDRLAGAVQGCVHRVLENGSLARSRKAAFELSKWKCLDTLIRVTADSGRSAVEDSTLEAIFLDGLDSLERIGEDHILPLLQCVRSLITAGVIPLVAKKSGSTEAELVFQLVRAGWAAMVDANKRRVAPTAAFLSAMVHPSLFPAVQMHQAEDGTEGPLKWLLYRLLEASSHSPRTMRLTAMHWSGLWLSHPHIARLYLPDIAKIALHGADSVDEELDGEIAESQTTAMEYAKLARSADTELAEMFTNSEMYPRVCVAITMHHLHCLSVKYSNSTDCELRRLSVDARECGRELLLLLLQAAVSAKDLAKELYKKKSLIHRRKVRVWQALCILSSFLHADMAAEVTAVLEKALDRNNMPSVRQYMESFAAMLYLKFPHLVEQHLLPMLQQHNMKPQALSSYIVISSHVILHAPSPELRLQFLHALFPAILPSLTAHHHALRGFTQVLIHHIVGSFPEFSGSPPSSSAMADASDGSGSSPAAFDAICLRAIYNYLETNHDCTRLRSAVKAYIDVFHPIRCCHPRAMFVFGMAHLSAEEMAEAQLDPTNAPIADQTFECVPLPVYDHVCIFLQDVREALRESMASDAAHLGLEAAEQQKLSSGGSHGSSLEPHVPHADSSEHGSELLASTWNFQRKIEGSRADLLKEGACLPPDSESEEELVLQSAVARGQQLAAVQGGRQDLIVVASLISRVPNLAGLARTCEVFKASALVMADTSVVKDKQFQLISVTAERWIPLVEVPESGLVQYLERRKAEGYSLVGLEQTANSVPIQDHAFQQKTVLVLGREKEGIPVDVIQALDSCVEIPQLGLIRSLNVHVSGAIATWEYTRQQLPPLSS